MHIITRFVHKKNAIFATFLTKSGIRAAYYIKKQMKPRPGKIKIKIQFGWLDWIINTHRTQTQRGRKNNSGRSEWDLNTSHTSQSSTQNTHSAASKHHKPVTTMQLQQPDDRVVRTKTSSSPLAPLLSMLSHTDPVHEDPVRTW
jgi:hypothetical protein